MIDSPQHPSERPVPLRWGSKGEGELDGPDLTDNLLTVEVTGSDRASLASWISSTLEHTSLLSESACVDWLATQRGVLPENLSDALNRLATDERVDAVVVRGLPVDHFPITPTPTYYRGPEGYEIEPADLLHGLLGVQLGQPFGYLNQQSGRLFNDIIAIESSANDAHGSAGFRHPFRFHTEDSFHPLPPTYFGLCCVRNPDEVPCLIASIRHVDLDHRDDEILRTARIRFNLSTGQHTAANDTARPRLPVLWGPDHVPFLRINLATFHPSDPDTRTTADAIERLALALEAVSRDVVLRPGDALWLDNRRVAHARDAYVPRFDGSGRWLKRLVVVPDLGPLTPLLYDQRIIDNSLLPEAAGRLPNGWEQAQSKAHAGQV